MGVSFGGGGGGVPLIPRETYILYLSTLLSVESLEKVPGGWVLESHFRVQLRPKPS